jgi:hypothetical protein
MNEKRKIQGMVLLYKEGKLEKRCKGEGGREQGYTG